ncbi:hypothetical protein K437DRAFT_110622 [Tilletiaria anomala UBC 951]|uniref:Uncharacterized protein n=1 Tax=Tilletiaria anomala (strain ATCC 24038 / CBS 436.72 / UBC 951) TaxID=1037660 RepID=A0A066W4W3_TILAU|nr:uncharacterized protein K437DRAFT_110622 [Tilletiaria anomala UBC 951]KDN46119.1 hypothetical protein K437DRAFT_110622 [Tilletiaria anomala UBC 951]
MEPNFKFPHCDKFNQSGGGEWCTAALSSHGKNVINRRDILVLTLVFLCLQTLGADSLGSCAGIGSRALPNQPDSPPAPPSRGTPSCARDCHVLNDLVARGLRFRSVWRGRRAQP